MRDVPRIVLIGILCATIAFAASTYFFWRLRMESEWTARCAAGESHACLLKRTLP